MLVCLLYLHKGKYFPTFLNVASILSSLFSGSILAMYSGGVGNLERKEKGTDGRRSESSLQQLDESKGLTGGEWTMQREKKAFPRDFVGLFFSGRWTWGEKGNEKSLAEWEKQRGFLPSCLCGGLFSKSDAMKFELEFTGAL